MIKLTIYIIHNHCPGLILLQYFMCIIHVKVVLAILQFLFLSLVDMDLLH